MQEAIRKGHIHLESNRKSDPIGDPSGPDGPDDRVCKGRAQCGLFVLPRPLQKHPVGHFLRVRADAIALWEVLAVLLALWFFYTLIRVFTGRRSLLCWLSGVLLGLSTGVFLFVAIWGLGHFGRRSIRRLALTCANIPSRS